MYPERWQKIDELLEAALECEPDQRAAFLERYCAGDEALLREVQSLLAACAQAGSFIETPPSEAAAEMLADRQTEEVLGRTLGHYKILSLLGAGGMGEVYRATDLRLSRQVAIKTLPDYIAQDPEALKRFEREAKALAALSHPNILAIHDFGEEQGVSYAVMELLEGETLRTYLWRSMPGWREAMGIGAAIADGLAAAHAKGIIHRDLKPENIFLTSDGQVKILDFGIARIKPKISEEAITATCADTSPGAVMGTIGYMSPEQVRGEAVDAPSDIFSLGCVLYEMVSGKQPFVRDTAAEMMAAILRDDPPSIAGSKDAPEELGRAIGRCLEKNAEERYQSARDLAFDLKRISSGTSQSAAALPMLRLKPAMWLVMTVVIALLGILTWLYLIKEKGKQNKADYSSTIEQAKFIDSLAVLPLFNASDDADAEYLSDGITESIINSLSQLPKLRVMARSAVFNYKGKQVDPRRVGQELNVRAVLTGKFSQRDSSFLVSVELVNAADGSQLWGERYNRTLSDVIEVQEDITRQISDKLRFTLSGEERNLLAKRHTKDADAYQLYLKGRYYLGKYNEEGFKKGLGFFRQAIDLDPNYALAYAGMADAYYGFSNLYLPAKQAMPKSRAAAMRAFELDEMLAEAHTSLAVVKSQYDWEWAEAEREYTRAIDLNPGYAPAHHMYGIYLVAMGRPDEALVELKRAQDLDPLSTSIAVTAVWPSYFAPTSARQYDRATEELQKIIAMDSDFPPAHSLLGQAYEQKRMYKEAIAELSKARLLDANGSENLAYLGHAFAIAGRRDEAERALSELERRSKRQHVTAFSMAIVYSGLGEKDRTFAWLERAYEVRDEQMVLLKVDPMFDKLRPDPRFQVLLRRMNLAE